MNEYACILVDRPRPKVLRITLNTPEKRNAIGNRLRREIFEALGRDVGGAIRSRDAVFGDYGAAPEPEGGQEKTSR